MSEPEKISNLRKAIAVLFAIACIRGFVVSFWSFSTFCSEPLQVVATTAQPVPVNCHRGAIGFVSTMHVLVFGASSIGAALCGLCFELLWHRHRLPRFVAARLTNR